MDGVGLTRKALWLTSYLVPTTTTYSIKRLLLERDVSHKNCFAAAPDRTDSWASLIGIEPVVRSCHVNRLGETPSASLSFSFGKQRKRRKVFPQVNMSDCHERKECSFPQGEAYGTSHPYFSFSWQSLWLHTTSTTDQRSRKGWLRSKCNRDRNRSNCWMRKMSASLSRHLSFNLVGASCHIKTLRLTDRSLAFGNMTLLSQSISSLSGKVLLPHSRLIIVVL
jgi:hypothetical protein